MNTFTKACSEGNFDEVMSIFQMHKWSAPRLLRVIDVDRGWTCLQWAAWYNHSECVKFLLTFDKLNVRVRDNCGQTALHISLQPRVQNVRDERGRIAYPREPCFEIIKMLLEVNNNVFVGCYKRRCARNIASSLMCHHLDTVKLLINCDSFVHHSKHILWHTAALYQRVDCMRYLLGRHEYDPTIRDSLGVQPYFIFFQRIIRDALIPTEEDIEFLFELLLITVKSPAESAELYFMVIDCCRYRGSRYHNKTHKIFTEILKLLLPQNHPRRQIVDEVLRTNLPSDYCLVTLILFDGFKKYIDNCELDQTIIGKYFRYLEIVKLLFLQELFTLYSANESIFNAYITEVVEMKWTFDKLELCSMSSIFPGCLSNQKYAQQLFNFTKSLILKKFNFVLTLVPKPPLVSHWSMNFTYDYLLTVFVPLWKCVNAPIELLKLLHFVKDDCHFNFNESENCVEDYKRLLVRNANQFEVVSLQNLSRMSLRKHFFENLSHYDALATMYSLNIPSLAKRFICYNYSDLEF